MKIENYDFGPKQSFETFDPLIEKEDYERKILCFPNKKKLEIAIGLINNNKGFANLKIAEAISFDFIIELKDEKVYIPFYSEELKKDPSSGCKISKLCAISFEDKKLYRLVR
jgi:hypothetical protein